MQIYDFGDWIKVEYWDKRKQYFKSLPKGLTNVFSIAHLSDGKIHKLNGPAAITYTPDGNVQVKLYFLNDNNLTKEEWEQQVANS